MHCFIVYTSLILSHHTRLHQVLTGRLQCEAGAGRVELKHSRPRNIRDLPADARAGEWPAKLVHYY